MDINKNATWSSPQVVETRPKELECDVVRFQNNKEKWVAFVGLLDGRPYEIFTGRGRHRVAEDCCEGKDYQADQ